MIVKMEAGIIVIPPPGPPPGRYISSDEWWVVKHQPPRDRNKVYFDLLVESVDLNRTGYIRGILELNLNAVERYLPAIVVHAYENSMVSIWKLASRFLSKKYLGETLGELIHKQLDVRPYLDWIISPFTNEIVLDVLIRD